MEKALFWVDAGKLDSGIRKGIEQLLGEYTELSREKNEVGAEVRFLHDPGLEKDRSYRAKRDGQTVTIHYGRLIDAFRALGRLMAEPDAPELEERCRFEMVSLQMESSRNGVLTPESVEAFLRRGALMGVNTAMLYLEDTYEVPGEPFFGYLRGRFTQEELKRLDDYAHALGIEMVPCIQTLGHMAQALQWSVAFDDVTDTADVMLAGEEKTYDLLDRMIEAASAPFRSKKIHLGMDEAFGMGEGKYRQRFGEKPRFELMNEHLDRVCAMCAEKGLEPMIWSDMYFRIASPKGEYYDLNLTIPKEVSERIPESVDLVYWDYYHTDQSFYEAYIDRHRDLGKEPILAPGCWNWNHFWTNIPYSLARMRPAMGACKAKGLKRVFMTTWGDDGMECDLYSTLPVIQVFADLAYNDECPEEVSARNFAATCRADFAAYTRASALDQHPPSKTPEQDYSNTSKWLMWDDPFLGLCEPFHEVESYREAYEELSRDLSAAVDDTSGGRRLAFPAQIAKVLALKCDCRKNLVKAYKDGDRQKMKQLAENVVRPLIGEMEKLWRLHRQMWLDTYKPFGLEVLEIRYGGQLTRLRSLNERVQEYCAGTVEGIPEFETELLPFAKDQGGIGKYRRIATASVIF